MKDTEPIAEPLDELAPGTPPDGQEEVASDAPIAEDEGHAMLFSARDLRLLLIPLILELTFKMVVGMVDSVMVASVGETAVSGVSMIDSVIQLMINIFSAMATGGAVVAGQYLGSRKNKEANEAADELVWLDGAISLALMVLAYLLADWIVGSLFGSVEPAVEQAAREYLMIIALSIPAIALLEAGNALFRVVGNTRVSMLVSILMNIINCSGNALLIYGFGMGVRGAAISTLVARWTAVIIIMVLLYAPGQQLELTASITHRFDIDMCKRILGVGIPNGIENGLFQMGKIALVRIAASFGTIALTANSVTQNLSSIQRVPGNAVSLATVPIVARCVGAREFDQARHYHRTLLKIAYGLEFVVAGIMMMSLSAILGLYDLSDETAALAREMFTWYCFGNITLWPIAFVTPSALRAAGDVRFTMVVSITVMWVFRLGGAWVLAYKLGFGAVGIWIAMSVLDWIVRGAVYTWRWRSGVWESMRVV
ncbi:MAG: MATE family efflux transporter [Atopobiaceae bacterium]|nr:MATE family efflux transporter [Atopobiaceae bacterium]